MIPTGLELPGSPPIFLKTTTSATGANWVVVGNANVSPAGPFGCQSISLFNNTAAELQFGIGAVGGTAPSGETFELPATGSYPIRGLYSTGQLFVRRTDQSNTQVTFKSTGESV